MKIRIVIGLLALLTSVSIGFGQTEVTIKKKTTMKIPGMPDMPSMPSAVQNPFKDRSSTVYIKGGRMRTDMKYQQQKISLMGAGGMETVTSTTIVQCDKRQTVSYNTKKKKYHVEPISGNTAANTKGAKKGGFVTLKGEVVDTGNRAKVFGYDARHMKETYTIIPSKDACQKQTMSIEIEGWYADVPEFSCPAQRKPREFQMDNGCFDDVDFQVKGSGLTGMALKEVKKLSIDGMTMIMEEEAISVTKTPIADSMFEPPLNYKAANTLKEVEDDSPDDSSTAAPGDPLPQSLPATPATPTFAPPAAGIERVTGPKAAGMIRFGVAKPKVTTPESKKDPTSGEDIASGVALNLLDSLKAPNVEAVSLETDFPENECAEKGCDYIFHSSVIQKRGGGGMFGKMVIMGAVSVAGAFIPGIGGMIASTVASQIMSQTMMKSAKAKDEFTFDYKVTKMDKSVFTQAVTKGKAEKDGEDVLTGQVQLASRTVISKLPK